MYRVDMADTGQPVGMAGLVRRDFLDGPDLGYAFLPAGTLVWPDTGETCALFDCDLSTVVG
jgi:hypothetical protein